MKTQKQRFSRRSTIKGIGVAGSAAVFGSAPGIKHAAAKPSDFFQTLSARVEETPLVDTHEHLIEENDRIAGNHPRIQANDWSILLSHYLNSDLTTAGMPKKEYDAFFSPKTDPQKKWALLEPYWWAVRNTGYGQAVEIAMQKLYGVESLGKETIPAIQENYLKGIKPGFYKTYLNKIANIESCQVNYLSAPFSESAQPTLLMQDISIVGMHMGPNIGAYAPKAGIEVKDLHDWHQVIDWWFKTYGPYAVAVKSQAAYSRNIDFEKVDAELAEKPFQKKLQGEPISAEEKKRLEDHLFWYAVGKANEYHLPVKLHTGYYAGANRMPLSRLAQNAGAATDLCRRSPETRFDFFHINYPNYEELISAAKQYTNAYIDMCWAWIINPIASKDFLKKYIVTAPANKLFTFGGDYIPVEPVIGHAALARWGITQALFELVEEGLLNKDRALELVDPLMRGNARRVFNLGEKTQKLKHAPWL